jgi:uncharacterized protein (TIGR03435 family)
LPSGVEADDACSGAAVPRIVSPGRLAGNVVSVFALVAAAYNPWHGTGGGCSYAQALRLISGGPGWTRTERFALQAVIPSSAATETNGDLWQGTAPAVQRMLQTLLATRFKLAVRAEKREMPVYLLSADANARTRMAESVVADMPAGDGIFTGRRTDAAGMVYSQIMFRRQSMERLSWRLAISATVGRPVIDRTGLDGAFDFALQFDDTGIARPTLFTAVHQLGLRLQPSRATVDTLVIEHIERPTEN